MKFAIGDFTQGRNFGRCCILTNACTKQPHTHTCACARMHTRDVFHYKIIQAWSWYVYMYTQCHEKGCYIGMFTCSWVPFLWHLAQYILRQNAVIQQLNRKDAPTEALITDARNFLPGPAVLHIAIDCLYLCIYLQWIEQNKRSWKQQIH